MTVLLVEDRADDRELFEEVLRAAGYRVMLASSGLAGYEQALADRPDVVIADIMMPGPLDGIELTRKLRMNARTHDTSVILLTAHSVPETREEALRAGAVTFLTKPCPPDVLVKEVGTALSRRQHTMRTVVSAAADWSPPRPARRKT